MGGSRSHRAAAEWKTAAARPLGRRRRTPSDRECDWHPGFGPAGLRTAHRPRTLQDSVEGGAPGRLISGPATLSSLVAGSKP